MVKVASIDWKEVVIKSYTDCPFLDYTTHYCLHPDREKTYRSPTCVSTRSILCPLKDKTD